MVAIVVDFRQNLVTLSRQLSGAPKSSCGLWTSCNPRQSLLSQTKIFCIFLQKSQCPTNSAEIFCKLPFPPPPKSMLFCLDSGHLLYDASQVSEINNIDLGDLGVKRGICCSDLLFSVLCQWFWRESWFTEHKAQIF